MAYCLNNAFPAYFPMAHTNLANPRLGRFVETPVGGEVVRVRFDTLGRAENGIELALAAGGSASGRTHARPALIRHPRYG